MGILWGQGWRSFPLEKALLDKVSQEILLKFHIFCFVPKSPMLLTYFFSSLAMGVHKTHEFYWERTCDAQTEIIFLYSILKIFIKHLSMKYLSPNGTCFAFLNIISCIHSCYWPIRLLKSTVINLLYEGIHYATKILYVRHNDPTNQFIQLHFHDNLFLILFSSVYFKHFLNCTK